MNIRILKKDLRRKKSMNFILLLFVMLATTFIAASISNIKVIVTGIDYYFEKANMSDYILNTMSGVNGERTDSEKALEEFLADSEQVESFAEEVNLMVMDDWMEPIGDAKIDLANTLMVSSVEGSELKFFDEKNESIRNNGFDKKKFSEREMNFLRFNCRNDRSIK